MTTTRSYSPPTTRHGLWRVSADGGEPTVLTKPNAAQRRERPRVPAVLPGGRARVVHDYGTRADSANAQVAVLDLENRPAEDARAWGSQAEYGSDSRSFAVRAAI